MGGICPGGILLGVCVVGGICPGAKGPGGKCPGGIWGVHAVFFVVLSPCQLTVGKCLGGTCLLFFSL